MQRSIRATLVLLVFSLAVSSCVMPSLIPQDPSAINTAAAQTVIAGLTQAALSALPTLTPSDTPLPSLTYTPQTPTLTYTLPPPSHTPTATSSLTPVSSATPAAPLLSVSVPTNCRSGPGKIYRRLGVLDEGVVVQVYGRDPTGQYWYIRNPADSSEFCWVWGEYATVWGNIAVLPVYTPPPTPRPTATSTPYAAFQAAYQGLGFCNDDHWAEIRLSNTGTMAFRSMTITIRDTVTDVEYTRHSNIFVNRNGCLETITRDTLAVGKDFVLSGPRFDYPLNGHRLHVNLTLCTQPDQKGSCVMHTLKFTP